MKHVIIMLAVWFSVSGCGRTPLIHVAEEALGWIVTDWEAYYKSAADVCVTAIEEDISGCYSCSRLSKAHEKGHLFYVEVYILFCDAWRAKQWADYYKSSSDFCVPHNSSDLYSGCYSCARLSEAEANDHTDYAEIYRENCPKEKKEEK